MPLCCTALDTWSTDAIQRSVQLDPQLQMHDQDGKRVDGSKLETANFEVNCGVCKHTRAVGPSQSKSKARQLELRRVALTASPPDGVRDRSGGPSIPENQKTLVGLAHLYKQESHGFPSKPYATPETSALSEVLNSASAQEQGSPCPYCGSTDSHKCSFMTTKKGLKCSSKDIFRQVTGGASTRRSSI